MALKNIFATKEDNEIAQILGQIDIFIDLTISERVKITKFFRKKSYSQGEQIFGEGDLGDRMFVIRDGAVRVVKSVNNEERNLANLVDGNFFGEMALLEDSPRSATVRAVSNVEMLELFRVNLQQLIRTYPDIGVKIMYNVAKILSQRIRQSGDKIKDLLVWEHLKQEKESSD